MTERSISLRVEAWYQDGLPSTGLTTAERMAIVDDAQGSFMAEFVARTNEELLSMSDKDLVACHFWAMNEATR